MIKRIAGWVILVPLALVLAVFALANRQLVVVNFNPLASAEALQSPSIGVPLFLVIYAVLLVGVVFGGIAAWLAQGRSRQQKRQFRREAERLNRELTAVRSTHPLDERLLGVPSATSL